MNIGENLKELRLEMNITQQELADKVNVSKSMICQIERNTKALNSNLAYEIAKALGRSITDLIK